jgi:transposase-like protein
LTARPIRLGGPGHVVQIDESMFGKKRKYHQGRGGFNGRWVFGMVDVVSKACYLQVVPIRNADTLMAIIVERALPGTTIWSDGWRAYRGLRAAGFGHEVVNHTLQYVRADGMNTNTIEGLWANCKSRLKSMRGTSRTLMPTYLDQYMYERQCRVDGKNVFFAVIEDIATFYPV